MKHIISFDKLLEAVQHNAIVLIKGKPKKGNRPLGPNIPNGLVRREPPVQNQKDGDRHSRPLPPRHTVHKYPMALAMVFENRHSDLGRPEPCISNFDLLQIIV